MVGQRAAIGRAGGLPRISSQRADPGNHPGGNLELSGMAGQSGMWSGGRTPSGCAKRNAKWPPAYVTSTDSGFGHVIVDYEKALTRGFKPSSPRPVSARETPADDPKGGAFLEGVILSAEGLIAWAGRYADLAEEQAAGETDPARRAELLRIAQTCRRVPAEPARDFREALQSFWFVHIAMHIEQFGWSISAGRFDQYMLPFYRQDLASGALTRGAGLGTAAQPVGQIHGKRGRAGQRDRLPKPDPRRSGHGRPGPIQRALAAVPGGDRRPAFQPAGPLGALASPPSIPISGTWFTPPWPKARVCRRSSTMKSSSRP